MSSCIGDHRYFPNCLFARTYVAITLFSVLTLNSGWMLSVAKNMNFCAADRFINVKCINMFQQLSVVY